MLDKSRIQDVILSNIFQLSTPAAANKIANELGLGPGSVVLGDKTIQINENGTNRHFQIGADGNSVIEVDPATL